MIIATRRILKGEELFISYSMYYDRVWDDLKALYPPYVFNALQHSLACMPPDWPTPTMDQLQEYFDAALADPASHAGLFDCVKDFLQYTGHEPDLDHDSISFPRHNYLPVYQPHEVSKWTEAMLRCNWFFASHFFRRLCDPDKPTVTYDIISHPVNPSNIYARSLRKRTPLTTTLVPPFGDTSLTPWIPTTSTISLVIPSIDHRDDYITFLYQYKFPAITSPRTISDDEDSGHDDDDETS